MLVRFALDGARFALPASSVREALRAVAISNLAVAPDVIEGVVNVRGEVFAVLDLRRRLGLRYAPLHPDQHFLIAACGARTVILRVDQVLDLVEANPADVDPTDPARAEHARAAGLARLPDGVVVILDLPLFLSLDEAAALDAALAVRAS